MADDGVRSRRLVDGRTWVYVIETLVDLLDHRVEVDGGLPGVRSDRRTEAVATCVTCSRTGRGRTRAVARKAIEHVRTTTTNDDEE